MCPSCEHTLAAKDLLPVLSWLNLKGRCRYCKKPIHWQYPLVELITAGMFVSSYVVWSQSFETGGYVLFGLWLMSLTTLIAMAIYDLKWMELPDSLTRLFTLLAATQVLILAVLEHDSSIITGGLYGVLAIAGLFYVLFQVSGGKWIGGGDVKLGVGLGLLAGGFLEGMMVIFFASLLGSLVAIPILLLHKTDLKKRVPFGPFLIVSLVIIYLFGPSIISWYEQQFLLV